MADGGFPPISRPGDKRSRDKRSGDKRPGDKRPGDKRPGDKRSRDKRPGDKRPGDKRSGDKMPTSLRTRFLETLRARLGGETLPLRIAFWDGETFDFAAKPKVTIALSAPRLMRLFLFGDIGGLGRAYVRGEIGVEGRVEDVLAIGIRIAERLGASSVLRRIAALLPRRRFRHSRRRDAAAIGYHYDVSNDFYRLWLDRHMVYSCAYFVTGEEDLDTAQEQKLDHICRKLRLKPGERLLDIGCGWGGLLCWAASKYGVRGVGITLSEQQRVYATEWIRAAGLARDVEIRLQDYREIAGEALFDKIVSVGMYEHVGIANLPRYFAVIGRLLRPAGLVLNHGITARAQAIAAAGAERYRIWRMYLAGMAHAFDRGWLSVCQTLALKPAEGRMAPRPWTRRYQYEPSAAVPISRGLDWGKT